MLLANFLGQMMYNLHALKPSLLGVEFHEFWKMNSQVTTFMCRLSPLAQNVPLYLVVVNLLSLPPAPGNQLSNVCFCIFQNVI